MRLWISVISSYNYALAVSLRYLMTLFMLIGTKHLWTLWGYIIILNGQLDQEKGSLTFWNLKSWPE